METDKDPIHSMIETDPTMSVSKIVNLMKSSTTYHIGGEYPKYLQKQFWKEHRLAKSISDVSWYDRLRGLRSRKPIGFRQWVVHKMKFL